MHRNTVLWLHSVGGNIMSLMREIILVLALNLSLLLYATLRTRSVMLVPEPTHISHVS